jgi:predicted regulator of Ras-like GTPase activity (Roadblock/LC7/MglB family)
MVLARLQAKEQQIAQLLKSLNREVRAESIMVTLGTQLIAFAGLLSREQAAKLANLVADSTDAAAQMATFLGEPSARFEQSMHEGAEYRMYSLSVGEGLVLSLALSSDTPLGTLRYRARQTAEELLELLP